MTLMVKGYCGIGDHVNERPFVLDAAKRYKAVYVETAFPDLFYAGIPNVICLSRTHIVKAIIDRIEWCKQQGFYGKPLGQYDKIVKLSYGAEIKATGAAILESFNVQLPHSDYKNLSIALPVKKDWEEEARSIVGDRENICFVKLPTIRFEHSHGKSYSSRNPKMEYIAKAIKAAKQAGFFIVSCADLKGYQEEFDGDVPEGIDLELHNGEISTTGMIGLTSIAKAIIAIPCNTLHFGIAFDVPTLAIFGGFSEPRIYFSPLKPKNLTCIAPKTVCNCFDVGHNCDKNIDPKDLNEGIAKFFGIEIEPYVGEEKIDENGKKYRLVMRHGVQRKLWL